ncbi:magnesium/cobalt transporter CorA, partial [Patescibacteria group bacterium]|nr:magnesium/cobalt transporter CorA [Patescibacteria group bacterium]
MNSKKNSNNSIKSKTFRKRVSRATKAAGSSPDTISYIGEERSEAIRMKIMNYDKVGFSEHALGRVRDIAKYSKKSNTNWINVSGIHDVEILKEIGQMFEIHPLTLEDIANSTQRPKIEDHKKYLFIVLKVAYIDEASGNVNIEQVSIVANKKNIITFQEGDDDIFETLYARIRKKGEAIRNLKTDFLIYAIIDSVIDHYFVVLEKYEDNIERIEDLLIKEAKQSTLNEIYSTKRELAVLRKSIWPSRDVINNLLRENYQLITPSVEMYFKDVYDHVIQIIETVEAMRDISTGMLDLYLSSVSNKMNEIMKILTMFSAVFIPLTFIVGVYGMNFKHMPELETQWGYFIVW